MTLAYENHKYLEVMCFLNDISERFPDAISLASGRPVKGLLDVNAAGDYIKVFAEHYANKTEKSTSAVLSLINQYGSTAGIINDIVSEYLLQIELVECEEDNILLTNGAQESMAICLTSLFTEGDVLLALDPAYVGITGLAKINNIDIQYVSASPRGLDIEKVKEAIENCKRSGLRAKAIYLVPDFYNPIGPSMTLEQRVAIIELCKREGIYILEDSPYRQFRFEGRDIPSMFSIDDEGWVIYLGTFSKTLSPGVRMGYLLHKSSSHQQVTRDMPSLISEFTKVKSFISVNTSQIAQAIVGGYLLSAGGSLKNALNTVCNEYKVRRDTLDTRLLKNTLKNISWFTPEGGFFISLRCPFEFKEEDALICAKEYGVIAVPLSFFSESSQFNNYIRLSYSYASLENLETGIDRLSNFLRDNLYNAAN